MGLGFVAVEEAHTLVGGGVQQWIPAEYTGHPSAGPSISPSESPSLFFLLVPPPNTIPMPVGYPGWGSVSP